MGLFETVSKLTQGSGGGLMSMPGAGGLMSRFTSGGGETAYGGASTIAGGGLYDIMKQKDMGGGLFDLMTPKTSRPQSILGIGF